MKTVNQTDEGGVISANQAESRRLLPGGLAEGASARTLAGPDSHVASGDGGRGYTCGVG